MIHISDFTMCHLFRKIQRGSSILQHCRHFFWLHFSTCISNSRRAASSQVAKPNSARAAGAGGSSNTMLRLYTDDSPGLRVYVLSWWSDNLSLTCFKITVTLSLYLSSHSRSSLRFSSFTFQRGSSRHSQNDDLNAHVVFALLSNFLPLTRPSYLFVFS